MVSYCSLHNFKLRGDQLPTKGKTSKVVNHTKFFTKNLSTLITIKMYKKAISPKIDQKNSELHRIGLKKYYANFFTHQFKRERDFTVIRSLNFSKLDHLQV